MRARENPFRLSRADNLAYRLQRTTWAALLGRLAALDYRAAIVGPYGSGKTTLLRALAARLDADSFTLKRLRLSEEQRLFPRGFLGPFLAGLTERDLILFDEADQLPWPIWHRFKRRSRAAGGLIVTVHRPGRLPTLIRCSTSPALLGHLVAELLGQPLPDHERRMAHLYHKHRGDMRQALRELYDVYAGMRASSDVESYVIQQLETVHE